MWRCETKNKVQILSITTFKIFIENKQYNKNRNMKKNIRLTEGDLHRIVKESVNKILKEGWTKKRNGIFRLYF